MNRDNLFQGRHARSSTDLRTHFCHFQSTSVTKLDLRRKALPHKDLRFAEIQFCPVAAEPQPNERRKFGAFYQPLEGLIVASLSFA
jgi:hypothetical protein